MTEQERSKGVEGTLQVLARLAQQEPEHPLISVDGASLSRREFLDQVSSWAGALERQGIGVGDRVSLITPNGLAWYVAFWATVSLGAQPVPLDPQIGAWELECLLSLLEIKVCLAVWRYRSSEIFTNLTRIASRQEQRLVLVCLDANPPTGMSCQEFLQGAPRMPVPSRVVPSSESLMLACTSGTTGNPKIIEVPHLGFLRAQIDMAATLGLSDDDRMVLGMPLFHQGGLGMGLQTLVAGGHALYLSRFDPANFLTTIQTARATAIQLSATLAKLLLSHPRLNDFDLSSVKLAYFAGEVLPDEVAAAFCRDRGIRVVNVMGSSETATMVMWDSWRDSQRSASEFIELPFTKAHVGDWDEVNHDASQPQTLWVTTDALLTRYYAHPDETEKRLATRDGIRWFDTQDLVVCLPDGYLRFVGRLKRTMKRGPNLVHPEELEAFLLTHPEIAAVAVVRADHELYGDAIVALVQPASGVRLTRDELLEFCRGKIAAYKVPDRIEIVDRLPVDIGKIQYKLITTTESSL